MTVSDEVREAGKALAATDPASLAAALNETLNRFVGQPFVAAPGRMRDSQGQYSEAFASTLRSGGPPTEDATYPADNLAAVVDAYDELTIEILRQAYARISAAKALKKGPSTRSEPQRTGTVGVILALRSALTLEVISDEIDRLNATTPETRWTDFIAVASVGTLHYSVQFPGQGELSEFLLPDENAKSDRSPPAYVLRVARPLGQFTLNGMLSFLIAHAATFATEAKWPMRNAIMEGVPESSIVSTGYQYNLAGALVPVPRQFHNDRYLPPRPFLINDHRNRPMAAIRFLPWQDGAVIMLQGKVPLEGVLVFLGRPGMERIIRLGDLQLSYVLPISKEEFLALLTRFTQRSNMTVVNDPGRLVMQKIADEGTETPFVARVMLGLMRLRDAVYHVPADRERFDNTLDHLMSSLQAVRDATGEIARLMSAHASKVASGEVVERVGNDVRILESIDRNLKQEVETFLNSSVRTMKTGLQNLGKELKVEIGFLFQKPASFERGIVALQADNPDLAAYLREVRKWSEILIKTRDELEHSLWTLPKIRYDPTDTGVVLHEPTIGGVLLTEFVAQKFDRLACFVEEFAAHCLQKRMPTGISITEIPQAARSVEAVERFKLTPILGGLPVWRITYHAATFDES